MKRIAIFAPLCAALALLAPAAPESAGQDKGKGKGGAFHPGATVKSPPPPPVKVATPPPVQAPAPPPVVHRTPGVGSIQPTVKTPVPVPVPVVKERPPVKEDVNAFIERNKGKFAG